MLEGQSLVFYVGLILVGLVGMLLVWAVSRFVVPKMRPAHQTRIVPENQVGGHQDAVVIVEHGGRVKDINPVARQLFGLGEGEYPNLEKMARRVRPSDEFLQLCAEEGQARFSVNGRLSEGTSYSLAGETQLVMLTIRKIETSAALSSDGREVSGSVIRILTEFSEAISSNLDLESTIRAILENVERLIPSDYVEINTWAATTQTLTAYYFSGSPGLDRKLEKGNLSKFGDYTNYLVHERKSLVVADTNEFKQVQYAKDSMQLAPVRSYIGIPLMAGGELVGTLEVGVISAHAFAPEDESLLNLIVGQAAFALHNAILFAAEQRRSSELLGLANLAQSAGGSLQETGDLYERLVNSLTLLFDVEIIGFLLYDENHRMLAGQVPFHGLPPNVVQVYQAPVPANSPLEKYLSSSELVLSDNAAEDNRWVEMGLVDIAQAASLRDTVLMPLTSGGRSLGFVQLSNHHTGQRSFSPDELRLLGIAATQLSTLLDNIVLVQQSRQRVQRSETLRRISSLVNSSATLDEILHYSIHQLAQLLRADFAAVFFYDEAEGILRGHVPSAVGAESDKLDSFSSIYVPPAQYKYTVTGSLRPFISGHLSRDVRVLTVYKSLVEGFHIESALVAPLVIRDHGVGEIMISSRKGDFFDSNDLQALATASGQLSGAVERSRTSTYTDENLRRRAEFLDALSRVVRVFDITTDIQSLVQAIYDESIRITKADCGSIIFFDSDYKTNPGAGISYNAGHKLGEGLLPLELDVLRNGKATIVDNYAESSYSQPHADVKSSLCVPVIYQGGVNGLIHLHAHARARFDDEDLNIARTLSVQAAISFGNIMRLREQATYSELLRRRADTLSMLFSTSQTLDINQPLEIALTAIAKGIQDATPFDVVLFSVYEADTGMLRRVAAAGIPDAMLEEAKSHQQPWKSLSQLLKPEFKLGEAYFIPADQVPVIPTDVHFVSIVSEQSETKNSNDWDPDDMLLYPLMDSAQNLIGMVSLDAPRNQMRPDLTTVESLEVFAAQASLTIASIRRVSQLRDEVTFLTNEVDRQKDMVAVSQVHLPALLRKDIQQTVSLGNLNQRSRRVRAGLDTIETISRQIDGSTALFALGREILTRFHMNISIVAEDSPDGPRLLHILGNLPNNINPESMFGQRNPLRASLQTGETILSANLDEDETWHDTPLLNALRAKSFICLPVVIGEKPIASVMATNLEPMAAFTEDDRQVYFQITRQISIILQNINLLSETRKRLQEVNLLLDFSRQISGLEPDSTVAALLANALKVISSAHAGTVLLWDEDANLLVPREASNYADDDSIREITYHYNEGLPGRAFASRTPLRLNEVNFTTDYNLPPESLLQYRKGTAGRMPVSSLILPIQTIESNLGVLVLDNFNTPAAFKPDDEVLLLSLTQQVALSLENVRLVQSTEERARQLQALNDVAATFSSSLRRDQLIAKLLERMEDVVPYDTAILWMRKGNRMVIAEARGFDDKEQRLGLSVGVDESALIKEMTVTGRGISVPDVRQDDRFPSLIEPRYLSWLGIPLIAKGEVMGVIAIEKTEPNYFSSEILQLATTFANQAAVALDNAALYEESVGRAAELDERSKRLTLLNQFSADLSKALDADHILRLTGEQLRRALDVTHVAVISLTLNDKASLQSMLPEEYDRPTISRSLPTSPVFDRLRQLMGVFTTDEISKEADLDSLADLFVDSQSLMVLPVGTSENLHALFVLTEDQHHFAPAEIELARIFANQAGIALANAQLYQSTRLTAERLETLNQASFEVSGSLNPEDIYKAIHNAVEKLMPVEAFVIAMLDEIAGDIEGSYIVDMGQRIVGVRVPYGQGLSGRVIASGEPLFTLESKEAESKGALRIGEKGTPHSIIAVPIFSGGHTVGVISVQSYQYAAYTSDDLQILSTLANQTSIAIQNGRLFAETQNLAATLEQRVHERTAQLQREQRNTETLLQILTEVSASLDLDRALSKTLALLNEAIGAEQGTIMLLNPDDNMLHYRAGYGYASATPAAQSQGFTLRVGEGLAGWVVKNRQPALVEDLLKDPRWVVSTTTSSQHRSAIVSPMMMGDVVSGAIMVFHRQVGYFNEDALEMVHAIGSQVAISINNSQLYELIRDQAERLGSMLRDQAVDASRQTAILEAVADGVLVTDQKNRITFVNASVERVLRLRSSQALDQPLEMFTGLFGKGSQSWSQTIREWSENPSGHAVGDTFAEQITLEDGRVVLVHLAPVVWRREFLGTVSIFRDITHEVEVDRLKSEFVATVSHELRTPMTSIRGYVDIMLMGASGAINDNQRHFLEIVKSNTERLNILVNDLLDISRIESGRVTLSFQALDMKEIADEIVANATRRAKEDKKPMEISVQAPAALPRVLGDVERIRQVLTNLVDNAYNYSHADGKIIVNIAQSNGNVQVDVMDNGIGIGIEVQDRVFERFYRGEDPLVLATPGTGLGLSIVKQIIEMHSGKIWMKSSGIPGDGSTFSFTLPVYHSEE